MPETNFKPLFEYLDEQFGNVHSRFEVLENKFDVLQSSANGLAKMTKNNNQEIIVINSRLDKLETKSA